MGGDPQKCDDAAFFNSCTATNAVELPGSEQTKTYPIKYILADTPIGVAVRVFEDHIKANYQAVTRIRLVDGACSPDEVTVASNLAKGMTVRHTHDHYDEVYTWFLGFRSKPKLEWKYRQHWEELLADPPMIALCASVNGNAKLVGVSGYIETMKARQPNGKCPQYEYGKGSVLPGTQRAIEAFKEQKDRILLNTAGTCVYKYQSVWNRFFVKRWAIKELAVVGSKEECPAGATATLVFGFEYGRKLGPRYWTKSAKDVEMDKREVWLCGRA